MKKHKIRSEASVLSAKSDVQIKEEIHMPPLDELSVKILSLQVTDNVRLYAIKVTFFDQLLLTGTIKTVEARKVSKMKMQAMGTMNYDPSDYEKMCLFANCPLVVHIQPHKGIETNLFPQALPPKQNNECNDSVLNINPVARISCCNVDILPLFIDKDEMYVMKRMKPMITPPILQSKSWDSLPLLTMQLTINRKKENFHHHELLKRANFMTLTLIGAFNIQIPYGDEHTCTAATNIIRHNGTNTGLVTFKQEYDLPKRFHPLNFYPKWESLRLGDDIFTKGDRKFACNIDDIQNPDNIDLEYYLSTKLKNDIIWGSFHRTLMLGASEAWLCAHLCRYSWPFEVHIYGEQSGLSFMGFVNLFHLIYPGENTVRMAVPLQWVNAQAMQEFCGCELLLTPNERASTTGSAPKPRLLLDSAPTSINTDIGIIQQPTGADDKCAFIIVEVKLDRPLKKAIIQKPITSNEIMSLLQELEQCPNKRECTGRGQQDRDWQVTVKAAESSLRRLPHYGMTEFCAFNRQLSETRTRVELMTSFWLESAIYVNNNFVVQEFLHSNETVEEMLTMAHACLMRIACSTLVGTSNRQELDPILKAARQARHMQDFAHAIELYLQVVVRKPRSANSWRELSTCFRDVDGDWANVCINKAMVLDPRHPLSLLAKGSILYEEDPEAAEPFFVALLALYPFWLTGWVVASAYYQKRELFYMADQIMTHMRQAHAEGLVEDVGGVRAWNYELGDWWDQTPLLPGMNPYYEAADLLLRLRAISLAETCLSRAITETGESAVSCHLLALCCRLRGDIHGALCHLQLAIDKFGDLTYFRSLQAECLHKKKNTAAAMACFEKAGSCLGVYSILLSMPCWEQTRARSLLLDLIRKQPSAYAWIALAEDWVQRADLDGAGVDGIATNMPEENTTAKACAAACAIQALKCDRQAGRAWSLLSKLVVPSARRLHYQKMAKMFHFMTPEEHLETSDESQQSLCHRLGRVLNECRCCMCQHLQF